MHDYQLKKIINLTSSSVPSKYDYPVLQLTQMPAIQQRSSSASFLPSLTFVAPSTSWDPTTMSRSRSLLSSSKLLLNLWQLAGKLFLNLVTVIDTSVKSSLGPQLSNTISKILLLDLISSGLVNVTRPCRPVLSSPSFRFTGPHTMVFCAWAEVSIPFVRCSATRGVKDLRFGLKEPGYGGFTRYTLVVGCIVIGLSENLMSTWPTWQYRGSTTSTTCSLVRKLQQL